MAEDLIMLLRGAAVKSKHLCQMLIDDRIEFPIIFGKP